MSPPAGAKEFAGRARAITATNVIVMGLAALAIFVVVNFLAGQSRFRHQWDLTDTGANTLSAKTLGILKELPAKLGNDDKGRARVVEIVSFLMPEDAIEQRAIGMVHQLLEAYRVEGGGRVTVAILDPYSQRTAARAKLQELKLKEVGNEIVVALGDKVRNVRLDDLVRMNHGNRGAMFGGRDEAPRIEENRIEETITSNILALLENEKPKAYFVSGHGEPQLFESERDGLSSLSDALRKAGYEVAALDLLEKGGVPADAVVVGWIAPKKPMAPAELAALRAYAQRGGRLLIAFEPALDPESCKDVLAFLADYGVRSPDGVVCEPILDVMTGQAVVGDPQCTDLAVRARDLSSAHPVTKSFFEQQYTQRFPGARALERVLDTPSTALVEDLGKTSKFAWIDLPPFDFVPAKPDAEGKTPEPMGPKTVMAAITWSAGAPASSSAPSSAPTPKPDAGAKGGRAIVLGAVATLRNDGFRFGRDLALSSIEWLAGREFAAGIGPRNPRKESLADVGAITPRVNNSWMALACGSIAAAGIVLYRRRRAMPGLVVGLVFGVVAVVCLGVGWLA